MGRHREIGTVDYNKLDTDSRDNANIGADYARNRQEILDMLAKFHEMEDVRLGCILIGKPHMELTAPDRRPINSAPYRAGPKARKFEKEEIDKTLFMNVIEAE